MRNLRKTVSAGISVLGAVLVFLAILLPSLSVDLGRQIPVVLLGLLLIEAGVWKLTERILPDHRRFHALRAEVDEFMTLMRTLNSRAVELKILGSDESHTAFQQSLEALHGSVDRMAEVAGRESEEED
ncbi:hypothetical protein ACFL3S_01720 [Gemmatimonadota bacterium]